MADISEKILAYIDSHEKLDTLEFAREIKQDHQKIIGAIKSIQTYDKVIKISTW